MTRAIITTMTPEERELQKKLTELAALESKLAQAELDLVSLKVELSDFQIEYLRVLGRLYAELDEVEAQIAEAKVGLRSGDRVSQEASRARAKADRSARGTEGVGGRQKAPLKFPEKLKQLYREIAKRFHPDLAADEAERDNNQQLMAEANQAYQTGDLQSLQRILERGASRPEAVKGNGPAVELVKTIRRIARIEERLEEIALNTTELKSTSLYQFRLKVVEAQKHGLELLQEMAGYLRREIAKARVRLADLTRGKKTGTARDSGTN